MRCGTNTQFECGRNAANPYGFSGTCHDHCHRRKGINGLELGDLRAQCFDRRSSVGRRRDFNLASSD